MAGVSTPLVFPILRLRFSQLRRPSAGEGAPCRDAEAKRPAPPPPIATEGRTALLWISWGATALHRDRCLAGASAAARGGASRPRGPGAPPCCPALARGAWVPSDRVSDSTVAYQGAAGGVDIDRIRQLHSVALEDFYPDLTFILDLDPLVGLRRTVERGEDPTRFEMHETDFYTRLRNAFLNIAVNEPKRCVVLDAALPPEKVYQAALAIMSEKLGVFA